MSKNGFTLAEVLITVLLICILSAFLIPAITNAAPKKNRMMFKKAYSSLQRAVDLMLNDESIYSTDRLGKDSNGYVVQRGFNNTFAVGNGTKNKFCYYLSQTFNTVGTVTCPASTGITLATSWDSANLGGFSTSDGVYWRFYAASSDEDPNSQFQMTASPTNPVLIYMDVNGPSKAPNCSAVTGTNASSVISHFGGSICSSTANCSSNPDIFLVDVRYDGKLHVGGFNGSAQTDLCAESILKDPENNN